MINRRRGGLAAAAAAVGLAISVPAPVQAAEPAADGSGGTRAQGQNTMLLVHGYGDAEKGKNCNGSTWDEALDYYEDAGGRPRSSMVTVGYYTGDHSCDASIGGLDATNDTPIQDIARDLAQYIHDHYSEENRVDIVAHSMGGLITRVAVLGTREGWDGFPAEVYVDNIVTLGTPHQGLKNGCSDPDADGCDTQWHQMTDPDAGGSGFIDKLHESAPGENDRGLDDPWADGIDWSVAGSWEDKTVCYESAIDKGYHADQKYGFDEDLNNNDSEKVCSSPDDGNEDAKDCSDPYVSHSAIRELSGAGGYCLRYWSASTGDSHTTKDGWSPLKVAFKAATYVGDDLPK